jgi:hypothetical protein
MDDFKTRVMLAKVRGMVEQQASASSFSKEEAEKVIKTTEEAIKSGKIKRMEDVKSSARAELEKLSRDKKIEF